MGKSQGVTLLEMLFSLTIFAVLSTIAVPGFTNLRDDARRSTIVNGLFHAVFLARSEAIKRGEVVTICKSIDGSSCANREPQWTRGWIVFANSDRDEPPQRDPEETLIGSHSGDWPGGTVTSNRVAYSFRPHTQGVVNGTIVFCDARGSAHARAIIISHSGRPRVAQRDASGRPLRCT